MMPESEFELAPIFQAVGEVLRAHQLRLNQADAFNGDHGDHIVQIFQVATRAAREKEGSTLGESMAYAARLLEAIPENGSAQVYANGLHQFALQMNKYEIRLDDLVLYVHKALTQDKGDKQTVQKNGPVDKSGDVLKAIMAALAGWSQAERGLSPKESPLDMAAMFEFGMAYIQAKQSGGTRVEVLADAAVSVTPLREVPHRHESGKLAIQALLTAMLLDVPGLEG